MFKERLNAGWYRIVDSVSVGSIEFVLAVHATRSDMFVTWQCYGNDEMDKELCGYRWGHYFNDELSAKADLLMRALEAVEVWHNNRGGMEVDIDFTEIGKLGVIQRGDEFDTGFIRYETPPELPNGHTCRRGE